MLWLARYYHDSIEATRVVSTRTGGDRSITGRVTIMSTSFSLAQKNQKEKKTKQKVEEVEGDENHDKNIIKWFGKWFLKESENERKLMARLNTKCSR